MSHENLSKSDGCAFPLPMEFRECLDINGRGAFHENPKSDTRKVWQDNPHPTCRGPQNFSDFLQPTGEILEYLLETILESRENL